MSEYVRVYVCVCMYVCMYVCLCLWIGVFLEDFLLGGEEKWENGQLQGSRGGLSWYFQVPFTVPPSLSRPPVGELLSVQEWRLRTTPCQLHRTRDGVRRLALSLSI
jgi:hypothetical protein